MFFEETKLKGAFLIQFDPLEDERGFFARTFCREEFDRHGLNPNVAQCSIAFNGKRGTLRGMHYQAAPHEEAKLVRCTQGAVYDVIVDLRPNSSSYTRWVSAELSRNNRRMLYVPEGFAHGYQTLEDDTEILYQMSVPYAPECARGVRWNDAAFAIRWPQDRPILSERDASYPDFFDTAARRP